MQQWEVCYETSFLIVFDVFFTGGNSHCKPTQKPGAEEVMALIEKTTVVLLDGQSVYSCRYDAVHFSRGSFCFSGQQLLQRFISTENRSC